MLICVPLFGGSAGQPHSGLYRRRKWRIAACNCGRHRRPRRGVLSWYIAVFLCKYAGPSNTYKTLLYSVPCRAAKPAHLSAGSALLNGVLFLFYWLIKNGTIVADDVCPCGIREIRLRSLSRVMSRSNDNSIAEWQSRRHCLPGSAKAADLSARKSKWQVDIFIAADLMDSFCSFMGLCPPPSSNNKVIPVLREIMLSLKIAQRLRICLLI